MEVQTPVESHEALAALQTLRSYHEKQETGDTELIRLLNRLEINLHGQEVQSSRQVDIRGYFGEQIEHSD
jgi:superfamily I DNA and/or RNA helicase